MNLCEDSEATDEAREGARLGGRLEDGFGVFGIEVGYGEFGTEVGYGEFGADLFGCCWMGISSLLRLLRSTDSFLNGGLGFSLLEPSVSSSSGIFSAGGNAKSYDDEKR